MDGCIGVLIGNWSEDKYGHELMQLDATRGLPDHVSSYHFRCQHYLIIRDL
jgi:hypothetical protein